MDDDPFPARPLPVSELEAYEHGAPAEDPYDDISDLLSDSSAIVSSSGMKA